MSAWSLQRFDGTWRLTLAGTFPGLDELGPMKLDPGAHEPGLARLEIAGEDCPVAMSTTARSSPCQAWM